jgi:flagellar basal-body rod modification protein FlgD
MAAFATGIFGHATNSAQTLKAPVTNSSPTAANGSQDGSGSSSTTSSTISANDFLTLLVTEMKNQDPTANNDPNQYINQLVNVNSLEQLIDINQNLKTVLGINGSDAHSAGSEQMQVAHSAGSNVASQHGDQLSASQPPVTQSNNFDSLIAALKHAPGNLTIPKANPAAQSLAHALDGAAHPHIDVSGLR